MYLVSAVLFIDNFEAFGVWKRRKLRLFFAWNPVAGPADLVNWWEFGFIGPDGVDKYPTN
jgi:hypothetical protein